MIAITINSSSEDELWTQSHAMTVEPIGWRALSCDAAQVSRHKAAPPHGINNDSSRQENAPPIPRFFEISTRHPLVITAKWIAELGTEVGSGSTGESFCLSFSTQDHLTLYQPPPTQRSQNCRQKHVRCRPF